MGKFCVFDVPGVWVNTCANLDSIIIGRNNMTVCRNYGLMSLDKYAIHKNDNSYTEYGNFIGINEL